jgi:propanol-preferring alcohol dehydrogenase
MKAVRLVDIGCPLQEQDIPMPVVGSHDVLIHVQAAGICHSDAHYRAGTSPVGRTPITPGHEVSGIVEKTGVQVQRLQAGDRVCVHYMVTCGECHYCAIGHEQFCRRGQMVGKHRDGGYAEYIVVPSRSVVNLPDAIPFEQGAIMMCSTATSYHALRKARLKAGETIAIFGIGGLGMSALQLAKAFGAVEVYAVDMEAQKLQIAENQGAIPISAADSDPVAQIMRLTKGRGTDVSLELVGSPRTIQQAVQSLAIFGRAVIVGITNQPFELDSYTQILGKEAEIIGASDHLLTELPTLFAFAQKGMLDLSNVVTETVPLRAKEINATLDALDRFTATVRTVIIP